MDDPKPTIAIKKPKQIYTKVENSVTLREFESELSKPIIICGFPSLTLTPILTAGYLVDQLKLPLIGMMSSPSFPTKTTIENGLPLHPIRIYGNKAACVVMGEFKFSTTEITTDVSNLILDFANRHRASSILFCEGLPQEDSVAASSNKLQFISTSDRLRQEFEKHGHHQVKEGVVSGITGVVMSEAFWTFDIEAGCIIAPTSKSFPSANGAVMITNALKEMFLLDICVDNLKKKADTLETSFAHLEREEKHSLAHHSMYG